MSLVEYNRKRNFKETPEPKGKKSTENKLRFVVQRHEARRLHFDFRLELGGVLKSWAVPKGPSMSSADKRFAVHTEDHPVDYLKFKGEIPEGNYGAGKMEIWDSGRFFPVNQEGERISERQALTAMKNGELKLLLKGKKIQGGFVLIRLKEEKNWLLIKHRDDYDEARSVKTPAKKSIGKSPTKKKVAARK